MTTWLHGCEHRGCYKELQKQPQGDYPQSAKCQILGYMMASLDMNDMNHTMRQLDLSTHMQTLYNLARYFRDKVTSEIELEPDQEEYIQVIKKECKNIIAILEQDTSALDLKQLMEIYIPRSLGIVDEDIPYLDWMETLIRDLLTAKPMWWPIYKQPQTSGQILATIQRYIPNNALLSLKLARSLSCISHAQLRTSHLTSPKTRWKRRTSSTLSTTCVHLKPVRNLRRLSSCGSVQTIANHWPGD
jgi:hypothetical protein